MNYLRQAQQDSGGLDELATQDPQVGLDVQVEAILHRRGWGKLFLWNQRIIDGEEDFGIHFIPY